jgi:hypothetical protein
MPVLDDRDEGLWGRVLLAILGFGLLGLGVIAAVMMTIDEDAGPMDGLYGLVIAGVGVFALAGAAIGRAFGRWAMLGVGLAFLAQATEIGLEVISYRAATPRSTVAIFVALVILAAGMMTSAVWQTVAHRNRMRTVADA